MPNRYSDWLPLKDAVPSLPPEAGIFQVKLKRGLLKYPSGRSAMLYYGYAENLQEGGRHFRQRVLPHISYSEDDLLLRYMPAADYAERFRAHLARFCSSFNAMPAGNEIYLRHKSGMEK